MKKIPLIISLLSLLSAFTVNEINLYRLKKDNIKLRMGETVISADDISYLNPARSFLQTGEFKNNFPGKGAYFLRPPGYSSIFVVLGSLFNRKTSLQLIKYIQLLLFAISVYVLFTIAHEYLQSEKWAVLATSIYGLTNIASGFLYYSLTEGITPALMIFYLFFLLKGKKEEKEKRKAANYYFSALIFAFLFVTRPVLGLFGLAIPFFIYADYRHNIKLLFTRMAIAGIIASSAMVVWQIRNWNIADEFVGFHPIYYPENSTSCFRPTHKALWKFCKGWGEIGSHFHSYIVPFWKTAIKGDTSSAERDNIINEFPEEVVEYFGKTRLDNVFKNYQLSILNQKVYYDKQIPMPKTIPETEIITINELNALTREFKQHFWFQYHILSPLKVFRELAFHSNLSLYVFQKPFRGNFFMEVYRLVCFLIHAGAFSLLILSIASNKPFYKKVVFSYAVIIYVIYLVYVQRGIEERYTLPILAIVLVSSLQIMKQLFIRKTGFVNK